MVSINKQKKKTVNLEWERKSIAIVSNQLIKEKKNSLGLLFFVETKEKKRSWKNFKQKQVTGSCNREKKKREKSCLEVCFYNQQKSWEKLTSHVFFQQQTHKNVSVEKKKKGRKNIQKKWSFFDLYRTPTKKQQEKLAGRNRWSFVFSKWNTYNFKYRCIQTEKKNKKLIFKLSFCFLWSCPKLKSVRLKKNNLIKRFHISCVAGMGWLESNNPDPRIPLPKEFLWKIKSKLLQPD